MQLQKQLKRGGYKDIAAAFDGTWQKRGHTSINGVLTVTSFDTRKVLDFDCLNLCILKRLPKTEFAGLTTLKLGVTDAVTCFNDGSVTKRCV